MTVVLVVGVRDASCLGCLPSLDSVLESARERERERERERRWQARSGKCRR
jgi:hypothetical protein